MKEIFATSEKVHKTRRVIKYKDGLAFERFPAYDTPSMKAFICRTAEHRRKILMIDKESKDERYLFQE